MRWLLSQARLSFQATLLLGLLLWSKIPAMATSGPRVTWWGSQKTVGQNQSWLAEQWNQLMLSGEGGGLQKAQALPVFARTSGHPGCSKRSPKVRTAGHGCA